MFEPTLPLFQTYLLPALPFRRSRPKRNTSDSSTSTTTSTGSTTSAASTASAAPTAAPESPPTYLTGHRSLISCSRCHASLALTTQIISKGFTGRHGRAYLVSPSPATPFSPNSGYPLTTPTVPGTQGQRRYISALPNTYTHKPVPRHLVTGMHTVADVSCAGCGSVVGWKYVGAEEEAQRYKVGKFILESRRTVVGCSWENGREDGFGGVGALVGGGRVEEVGDDVWGESTVAGRGHGEGEVMFDSGDEDECEDLFAGVWSPALARKRRGKRVGLRARE